MNDIDENTKLFQKYLDDKAPLPRKLNKNCAHPHVQGGLPPHLLKKQEDPYYRNPRATVSVLFLPLIDLV